MKKLTMKEKQHMKLTKTKKTIKKRKPREIIYCQRCGGKRKAKFQIQLTPNRIIKVCGYCFNWSLNKSMKEIRKDYAERSRRNKGGRKNKEYGK